MLEIRELRKEYDGKPVVKDLSFYVNEKEILGFLGPNGAGKSTTINIISTALKADGGIINFRGKNITKNKKEYKRNIGIVPQKLAIFENIPAIDNIKFFGGFYNLGRKEVEKNSYEALEMVGLKDREKCLPKTFSGGMKRRLNIACSLAHKPKLIVLDEPTVGIDPQSRNHILEVIKTLRDQGTTIIYTTHYMEEVEAICDRVVIVDKGEKIKEGLIKELIMRDVENYEILGRNLDSLDLQSFKLIKGIKDIQVNKDNIRIVSLKKYDVMNEILKKIINDGIKINDITKTNNNLEKVFLDLTGKRLRD